MKSMKTDSIPHRELMKKELFLKASLLALVDALASESRRLEELLEAFGPVPPELVEQFASPAA